jgi:hypothetical protein
MARAAERHPIEVRVDHMADLLDDRDPTPVPGRSLNPYVTEFVLSWAYELPPDAEIDLVVHVREASDAQRVERAEAAVRAAFAEEVASQVRSLKDLFRGGRISLAIGLLALVGFVSTSRALANATGWLEVLREGLAVAGWVALWRPLEIYLYDWWPIRRAIRTYRRLEQSRIRFVTG